MRSLFWDLGLLLGIAVGLVSCQAQTLDQPVERSLAWQEAPFFQPEPEPDPVATEQLNTYLNRLRSRGLAPSNQGVFLQSGLTRLATHQADQPRSAASLTKIATTVAAVEKWGLAHRFVTTLHTTGPIEGGVLQGDLIVQGTGSPFFVWEEAIAVGNALQSLGIDQVAGNLVVVGPFYMNYKTDATVAGQLFKTAINHSQWPPAALQQYAQLPPDTAKPRVTIQGNVQLLDALPPSAQALFRHESISLANILKQMNIYSNNVMSEVLAQSAGGADAVATLAAQVAQVPSNEIQLINGSGLGIDNRISPRAAVAMLIALDQRLVQQGASITDVMPVVGRDRGGTLKDRNFPTQTLLKTGTLNSVSALAGILPTRDRGRIWFALINGGGDILQFRREQDVLLQSLTQAFGAAPLLTDEAGIPDEALGDPRRIVQ